MANDVIIIVALVIGLPIIGGTLISVAAITRGWWLRARELKIQEKRIQMEEKLRSDELNARIIRMDDYGVNPADMASLADEVRQLRQAIAEIRQDLGSRTVGG